MGYNEYIQFHAMQKGGKNMSGREKSRLFSALLRVLRFFYLKMEVVGMENLPDEPVIIAGNHTQMHGPIACELYFPENRWTWCAGQMMHLKEVPEYAFEDFWSQKPEWSHWFYRILSHLVAPLSVYIFNRANTIEVYRDARVMATMRETLNRLQEGANIVVFPEQDKKYNNIIYDFQEGFIDIARMYHRKTGKELCFVPLYIAPSLKKMILGKPIRYCAANPVQEERARIRSYLMNEITDIARALPRHRVIPYRNIRRRDYPFSLPE